MISRGIWVGLVAIAFVAGTLVTGTMAYGATQGKPFGDILDFVNDLSDSFTLHDEDVFRHTAADQLVEFRDGIAGLNERVTNLEGSVATLESEISILKGLSENHEERIADLEEEVEELGHKVTDILAVIPS